MPDTKAGLYQQFVETFYTWKENRFPTTEQQQEELNAALGRLAKRAIDSEASRFRLRHKFVREELGDPKQQGSLFWLALRLGWLNEIGLAAESVTKEKVYAFYHPTFQEYFAALAVDDWDFFLPREHKDRPVKDKDSLGKYKAYRIFEPQWKEGILLWLGRENVAKVQKEEFMEALVKFKDGFYNLYLYWLQAYFLAAEGVAEFADCSRADEIVMQIVQWAFGYFDSTQQKWQQSYRLDKKAKKLLRKALRNKVIVSLTQLLQDLHDEENYRKLIDNNGLLNAQSILGEIQQIAGS